MRAKLLTLLIIVISIGCEKKNEPVSSFNQKILFQYEYTNQAWGYQHRGWMIDSCGNVLDFSLPVIWNSFDTLGFISNSDMNKNIEQLHSSDNTIDRDTLKKYMVKILNASNGIITEPRSEMYDAGIAKYSAFVFDDKSEKYKQIMIKQTGDWFIDNKSPEANEIYNWMVKLNK